jgi:hypothetical protein
LKDGEVGFIYFDVLGTKPRVGVVTVAYQRYGDALKMGMAFCSPKEHTFRKRSTVIIKRDRDGNIVNEKTMEGGCDIAIARMFPVAAFYECPFWTPAIIRTLALAFIPTFAKEIGAGWMQKKGVRIEAHKKRDYREPFMSHILDAWRYGLGISKISTPKMFKKSEGGK